MALRHNITDNPQMLGLAKSKVAQLRSTMAKKTKHLSQIINTKDGLMKLRIAGENEYAYLLKNNNNSQGAWILVAEFRDNELLDGDDYATKNKKYAQVIYHEYHNVYLKLKDASLVRRYPTSIDPFQIYVLNWRDFLKFDEEEWFTRFGFMQIKFYESDYLGKNIMEIEYSGVWETVNNPRVYIKSNLFVPLSRPFMGYP